MTKYREILRLHSLGINQTGIAEGCGCARKTVRNVLNRAKELDIAWPLKADITDANLERQFFPDKSVPKTTRRHPDYEYIDKEIMRSGVTPKLLWNEYCEECRQSNEQPLMYSQFCFHYQKHSEKKRATLHIQRKPGDQIEVDWAGKPAAVVDRDTDEIIPAYIFVGVLSYSMYTYVEAFFSMDMENWIAAHVHMYQFFGGVTRGNITTWITAALRNQKFFTLQELNKEIRIRLDIFNKKPFQKKEGSRYSFYLADEKPFLAQLPTTPYELAQWKQATVQFNYHISVDKMQYSVPELLAELAIARGEGSFKRVINQYKKYSLLILDEWMLVSLTETEARDLLEIIHARHKNSSTIFCSQFAPGWYKKFTEAPIADAILDRIVHDSYTIEIQYVDRENDKSMREVYGIDSANHK